MKLKVLIKEQVNNKIKYTCSVLSSNEWAGILFYKIIRTKKENYISVEDILIQTFGSGATVETDVNTEKEVALYRINHFKNESIYTGRIHSHNNMGVFFSGTDEAHLRQMVGNNQPLLSIVTNNNNEFVGRFLYYYPDYFGTNTINTIDTNIVVEYEVDSEFQKKIIELKEKYNKSLIQQRTLNQSNIWNWDYGTKYQKNYKSDKKVNTNLTKLCKTLNISLYEIDEFVLYELQENPNIIGSLDFAEKIVLKEDIARISKKNEDAVNQLSDFNAYLDKLYNTNFNIIDLDFDDKKVIKDFDTFCKKKGISLEKKDYLEKYLKNYVKEL